MCFSPEFDLVAGTAIAVVAVDTLRQNRRRRTLPIALLPAVFAAHTFMSAAVWFSQRGVLSQSCGTVAESSFMFIAFVFLPIYVPIAVLLLEPPGWRRISLIVLSVAGSVSGIDYLLGLLRGDGAAVSMQWYMDYSVSGTLPFSGIFYLAATCGAMLLSGYRPLMLWGVLNVLMVALLAITVPLGLPSLWCLWAAITSVFVDWFIRTVPNQRHMEVPEHQLT